MVERVEGSLSPVNGRSGSLRAAVAGAVAAQLVTHRVDAAAALRRGAEMGEHLVMGARAMGLGFLEVLVGDRVADADIRHLSPSEGPPSTPADTSKARNCKSIAKWPVEPQRCYAQSTGWNFRVEDQRDEGQ